MFDDRLGINSLSGMISGKKQIQPNYTEKLYPVFNTANSDFMLTMFNLNYARQNEQLNN